MSEHDRLTDNLPAFQDDPQYSIGNRSRKDKILAAVLLSFLLLLVTFTKIASGAKPTQQIKSTSIQLRQQPQRQKSQVQPTVPRELPSITVVVIARGSVINLKQQLRSLNNVLGDNIYKKLVIYDGSGSQQLTKLMETYEKYKEQNQKIQWIITKKYIGQIGCLDQAFERVDTPYLFLSIGSWNYLKEGFIAQGLEIMENQKQVSQVVVTEVDGIWERDTGQINIMDTTEIGFNLYPSLHRVSAYKDINSSFTKLTKNITYGLQAGDSLNIISYTYLKNGYKVSFLATGYAELITRPNIIQPYFQYDDSWLRRSDLSVRKEEKGLCRVHGEISRILRKQRSLRRQIKKQISRKIKAQEKQLDTTIKELGLDTSIQMGSIYDYIPISKNQQYTNITSLFPKTVPFTPKNYQNYQDLQQPQTEIKNYTHFAGKSETDNYINAENIEQLIKETKRLETKLGVALVEDPMRTSSAEYLYYSDRYQIDKVKNQARVCVFVEGRDMGTRGRLEELIKSVNNQNYSNYQLVFVSDYEKDQTTQKIQQISKNLYPRVFNRLKVSVKNEQIICTAGNHYLRVVQYCKRTDIVLSLNSNSSLIGKQAFNVINTIFQNKTIWMAFFPGLKKEGKLYTTAEQLVVQGQNRKVDVQADQYLIAYRYALAEKLPIQSVLEFERNELTGFMVPKFYETESNIFHIYSFIEMSGPARIKYQKISLHLYSPLDPIKTEKCWLQKQSWTKSKAYLKYPLHQLAAFNDTATINKDVEVSEQAIKEVRLSYNKYKKCMGKTIQNSALEDSKTSLPLSKYMANALAKMRTPNHYITDQLTPKTFGALPFCLVVHTIGDDGDGNSQLNSNFSSDIIGSVYEQNYSNYTLLIVRSLGSQDKIQVKKQRNESVWSSVYNISIPSHNYLNYKTILQETCLQNSLIFFLNSPLAPKTLTLLNQHHQTQNSWLTYTLTPQHVQINSFYFRVFQLLEINDFGGLNGGFIGQGDPSVQALGMLELCPSNSFRFRSEDMYQSVQHGDRDRYLYLRASLSSNTVYKRSPYAPLLTLQQTIPTPTPNLQHPKPPKFSPGSHLTRQDLLKAFEYQQLPYLPDNHVLGAREYGFLERSYGIGKEGSKDGDKNEEKDKEKEEEERFCLVVDGVNGRYENILSSILRQNYTNYHIVLFGDLSSPNSLQQAAQYLQSQKFPPESLAIIQPLRLTMPSYNLLHAAFHHCHEDDIQIRVQSEDELIGRNVLRLLDTVYRRDKGLWVVYTAARRGLGIGVGSEIGVIGELVDCKGERRDQMFMGQLMSWRVKLLRSIPLKYHQMEPITSPNIYSHYALQYYFVDLSTISRIKYIPYISYSDNIEFDDEKTNPQYELSRTDAFEYVMKMEQLKPLKGLDDPRTINQEVEIMLREGDDIDYQIVDY